MYTIKYTITKSSGLTLSQQYNFNDFISCTNYLYNLISDNDYGSELRYWIWKDGNSFNLIAKGKEVKSLYGNNE